MSVYASIFPHWVPNSCRWGNHHPTTFQAWPLLTCTRKCNLWHVNMIWSAYTMNRYIPVPSSVGLLCIAVLSSVQVAAQQSVAPLATLYIMNGPCWCWCDSPSRWGGVWRGWSTPPRWWGWSSSPPAPGRGSACCSSPASASKALVLCKIGHHFYFIGDLFHGLKRWPPRSFCS